jgi:surfactin synthase thioesterase subunit
MSDLRVTSGPAPLGSAAPVTDWLRVFTPRPAAAVQLVCFPHAGGTASVYRDLAAALPASIELVAVQYPGRQDRYHHPMVTTMPALVDELRRVIEPRLARPTAFFGHSMGATVAFEVARTLRPRFPSPLRRLFVSARKAPGHGLDIDLGQGEQGVRELIRGLGGRGATELLADEELWRLALPALHNDLLLTANHAYVPGSPLSCPITAIVGTTDRSVPVAEALGWTDQTIAAFDLRTLRGGHFYLEDSLDDLAALLADALSPVPTGRQV